MRKSTGIREQRVVKGGDGDLQALVDQAIAEYTSSLRYRFRVGLARVFGIKDPAPIRNVRRLKEIAGLDTQAAGASQGRVVKGNQTVLSELDGFLSSWKGFWARRNPLFKALKPVLDQYPIESNPGPVGQGTVTRPGTPPGVGEGAAGIRSRGFGGDLEAMDGTKHVSFSDDTSDTDSSASPSPRTPRVRRVENEGRAPVMEPVAQLGEGGIAPVAAASDSTLALQEQYGLAVQTIASLESRLQEQNKRESELNHRVDQLTRQLESRPQQATAEPDPVRMAELERQVQALQEEKERLQQRLQEAPAADVGFAGPPAPPAPPEMAEGGFAPPPPPPPGAPPPPPLAGPPKPLVFKKKGAQPAHAENPQGLFAAGEPVEAQPAAEEKATNLVDELKKGKQLKKVDMEAVKREREAAQSKEPDVDVRNALASALGKMRGGIAGRDKGSEPKPKKEGAEDSNGPKKKGGKWA